MDMSGKTELLAPAKDKETAFYAIDCGADAVYIGAPAFGARQNAKNSLEDIQEVVNYAHKFWTRVHVTINTILDDSELDEAVKLVYKLSKIGVDAIIVQDMGLIEKLFFSSGLKNIKLPQIHMSTQCDNYLPEKIKFFNNLGVSRVILARELSIDQINEIHKQNPNLELESFIHGALCVSMSGQCYMSQYIGGRSANRGECAQPCRKKYDIITQDGKILNKNFPYPLCLKDFNASQYIDELINAGVYSFKIEGRLKDYTYVKNIVSYYRNLIPNKSSSGKSFCSFVPNPEKSFNRGFTDYFLKKRKDCYSPESPKSKGEYLGKIIDVTKSYFTIKTFQNLHNQDGLYFNDSGCLINKCEKRGDLYKIYPNRNVNISAGEKVYRNLDFEFEKELQKPVKRQIGVNIVFENNTITATDEDEVSAAIKIATGEITQNPQKMQETFVKQLSKTGESDFYICDIKIASTLPFMKISEINELRRNLFELLMSKRLEVFNKNKKYQSGLKRVKYYRDEVDYRANIHNSFAKKFYEEAGCKVKEYSFEKSAPLREIELMRTKHCIKNMLGICKSPLQLYLRDEKNKIYPLKFNCKKCEMSVLTPLNNKIPLQKRK